MLESVTEPNIFYRFILCVRSAFVVQIIKNFRIAVTSKIRGVVKGEMVEAKC